MRQSSTHVHSKSFKKACYDAPYLLIPLMPGGLKLNPTRTLLLIMFEVVYSCHIQDVPGGIYHTAGECSLVYIDITQHIPVYEVQCLRT